MTRHVALPRVLWVGLLVVGLGRMATAAAPANDLPNGSFEQEQKGRPLAWRTEKWAGSGKFEYAETGHTGKRSLMISAEKGGDLAWTTRVVVEPYATYRLSGWIKTENVKSKNGRGALLNIHNMQRVATKALTGSNDWTHVEVTFDSDEDDAVQINCLLGGWGTATGKAWFDDVTLQLVGRTPPPKWEIAVDAAKVGQPVSKYIYGQFIEHLGRCIYGGIWAEMLEDRKFFFGVGENESPWKVVGPAEAVTMVDQAPFVGKHTPRINLAAHEPRGFMQEGLGLVAGKTYVGRIWLSGTSGAGPVRVSLIWGDGPADRQTVTIGRITPEYVQSPLEFTAGKRTDEAKIEVVASGSGTVAVGTLSLMPGDNVQGMRADTLAVLKELDAPVYRWPGGNFVSGYDWKDGIGQRDRRPPRKNPAWLGVEHNDFGMDEYMIFCRMLKTDPYIAVNSGLGEVASAAEEVQYANGAADTPMGQRRAAGGHREPYGVKFWGVGNEMYGGWQLGHMSLDKYVAKHNQFAQAMRAIDPAIKLVGVGDVGRWSEEMLKHCADNMDLISEHFYCHEKPGLYAHVRQIPAAVKNKVDAHRRYREEIAALKGKDIRIALDEWNYWYGGHEFGELGTRYFLRDGLGIAAGLHEIARNSDMFYMANYAQTVNVIGCIKTSKTAAAFETTGLVLKLYRHHFGVLPVATETSRPLDAAAAWTADKKRLTLAVVNPKTEASEIPLLVKGAKLKGTGTRWQIAGNNPMAYNDPSDPNKVRIEQASVERLADKVTLAPCSVTLFELDVE